MKPRTRRVSAGAVRVRPLLPSAAARGLSAAFREAQGLARPPPLTFHLERCFDREQGACCDFKVGDLG